jgi:hypothetical protein
VAQRRVIERECRVDDHAGEQVARPLLDRRGEPQDFVRIEAGHWPQLAQSRLADRHRSGLVEHGEGDRRKPLQRRTVSHDDLAARGPIDPADDRDRRREDEWTGCRDDQDGKHPQRVMRRKPCRGARGDRRRSEPYRPSVREALKWRPVRLRGAHELHDARVLAVGRQSRRAQAEHAAAVESATHHARARGRVQGRRFTGQRRDVQVRVALDHLPVAGHEVSRAHEQRVAHEDVAHWHVVNALARNAVRNARRGLLQRADRRRGLAFGVALERLSAALHQHDHEAGERLHEHDRTGDRKRSDDVGRKMPVSCGDQRAPQYRRAGEHQPRAPHELGRARVRRKIERTTDRDAHRHGGGKPRADGVFHEEWHRMTDDRREPAVAQSGAATVPRPRNPYLDRPMSRPTGLRTLTRRDTVFSAGDRLSPVRAARAPDLRGPWRAPATDPHECAREAETLSSPDPTCAGARVDAR